MQADASSAEFVTHPLRRSGRFQHRKPHERNTQDATIGKCHFHHRFVKLDRLSQRGRRDKRSFRFDFRRLAEVLMPCLQEFVSMFLDEVIHLVELPVIEPTTKPRWCSARAPDTPPSIHQHKRQLPLHLRDQLGIRRQDLKNRRPWSGGLVHRLVPSDRARRAPGKAPAHRNTDLRPPAIRQAGISI